MEEQTKSTETTTEGGETQTQKETYTKAEVDAMLQSEADRRVSEALKTAEKKAKDRIREAEKLAKMSEEEKYKFELEQREQAIAEKEKQLALAENKSTCVNILADKNIPVQLVDFVVDVEADVMKAKIQLLDKYFKQAVNAEVTKRLGDNGGTPKKGSTSTEALTKESFKKLSLIEQQELYIKDKDLYMSLRN